MGTALTRGAIPYKPRSVAWYDLATGEILDERDSQVVKIGARASVTEVLRNVRARVLYLLPDANGQVPGRAWYAECVKIGCRVDKYLSKVHSATISRGEKVIDIFPVSQYFDTVPNVVACSQSWRLLRSLLRGAFGEHATLMGTAAATGLHLLRLSLPREHRYEPLPADVQERILHNFGQGRIETFYAGQAGGDLLADLYEIDGVWMYMACLRDCPTGPCVRDEGPGLVKDGYTPGFYRVLAEVPRDWQHVGLLPAYDEEAARRHADIKTWYPNEPGKRFESWCTNAELRFALQQGWRVKVRERLYWPERSSDPLRLWAERLKRLRERCVHLEEPQRDMLRQAFRSIVLKAIGSFYRHEVSQDSYVPVSQAGEIPETVDLWEVEDADTIHYTDSAELSKLQLQTLQPHWAAWIWGNARKRLAEAALELPAESLVALRTDGIWTSHDPRPDNKTIWAETGKPGSWRVKYHLQNVARPQEYREMLAIIGQAKQQGRLS